MAPDAVDATSFLGSGCLGWFQGRIRLLGSPTTKALINVLLRAPEVRHAILYIRKIAVCQRRNFGERTDAIHFGAEVIDTTENDVIRCSSNAQRRNEIHILHMAASLIQSKQQQ
ncbi:hypothetical protein HY57_03410 [Dyella japonica A8]|uniref:Uncharacterized protein n=1 Tax=Dyella japonica A8 TaxID=1217721 RepID=A0A075JWU8_9GAMM|nr:hypothetical protein HY57_03410 [Dyella japonica A8]